MEGSEITSDTVLSWLGVFLYSRKKIIIGGGGHIVCDAFIIIMVTMATMSTLWSWHNDAKFTVDTSYAFRHLTCVKQVIF